MSQENVEVVRAIYDSWSEGDFRASVDLLDRTSLGVGSGVRPGFPRRPDVFRHRTVAAYTRGLLEAWTDFTMEAEEIAAAGDSVIVAVRQRGVGRISGVPTELRYFTLWSFRGRKVIRLESVREGGEAFEAAGLSEYSKAGRCRRTAPDGDCTQSLAMCEMSHTGDYAIRAGDGDWSPNGERLVFEANPHKKFGEVYRVDPDGRHLRNLTHNDGKAGARDPVWSPNGKRILFGDGRRVHHVFEDGLATLRPDGSSRAFISRKPRFEHQPDWESIPFG